jgi:glycosyltransferase involved in cell wall biosynthesis
MRSVDVVVPCYNYARFLTSCVNSVLNQNDVDVRVLIIDDASSDDTLLVGQNFAERDPRVTFRRHVTNRGNINTYNEGIEWASGDYFLLLSADDWLLPGALARAARVLDEHTEVVLTWGYAAVAKRDESLPGIGFQNNRPKYRVVTGQSFIETACSNGTMNPIWTPTAIVRTVVQKSIGGYSNNLPHAGDLEMWLRFACRGSIAFLDAWQAVYRKHEANMHYAFTNLANLRQHLLAFESAFEKDGHMIVNREALREQYRRSLALGAVHLVQHAPTHIDDTLDEAFAFAKEVFPKIQTTEMSKKYHLAWSYGAGLANIRVYGIPPGTKYRVWGIPLYLFRNVVAWTVRWVFAVKPSSRFYCKRNVWGKVGEIVESYRQSRSANITK